MPAACTTVTNGGSAATYTCTSASDSDVNFCAPGYWEDTAGSGTNSGTASVCSGTSADDTHFPLLNGLMRAELKIGISDDDNSLCNASVQCLQHVLLSPMLRAVLRTHARVPPTPMSLTARAGTGRTRPGLEPTAARHPSVQVRVEMAHTFHH